MSPPSQSAAITAAAATALLFGAIACSSVSSGAPDSAQPGQTGHSAGGSDAPDSGGLPADYPNPQQLDDAAQPPTAGDLERFTSDLGDGDALIAELVTTHGTLTCELFPDEAPVTVANFVGLARGLKAYVDPASGEPVSGTPYFDEVTFHRVIPEVLVQTGDRSGRGNGGPGYTISDEITDELNHDRPGVLSMANRGPDTAGSQFFITEKPLPHLDEHHTVFGHCEPQQVVRTISHVPTRGMNHPLDPPPRIEQITFERRN